jgi:hypothetical protein
VLDAALLLALEVVVEFAPPALDVEAPPPVPVDVVAPVVLTPVIPGE